MHVTQEVTLSEAAGGLFDFNATLPLEALQFLLLTFVLRLIFYKPMGEFIDKRNHYSKNNLLEATSKLLLADELCQLYDERVKQAKKEGQDLIAKAVSEANEIVDKEVTQTKADAASLIKEANKEFQAQKKIVLQQLEPQIDVISQLIKEKLLH
jgi:F-type H+-transporting ATPase subunit b